MRFLYGIVILGILALCAVLLDGSGHVLFAQPLLPSPPARPVPWGSESIIGLGVAGYALWKMLSRQQ